LELSFHDLLLNTIMKSLFADFSRVQHQTVWFIKEVVQALWGKSKSLVAPVWR
jgi:hypothetical protein